jgi:hypothetical protein
MIVRCDTVLFEWNELTCPVGLRYLFNSFTTARNSTGSTNILKSPTSKAKGSDVKGGNLELPFRAGPSEG